MTIGDEVYEFESILVYGTLSDVSNRKTRMNSNSDSTAKAVLVGGLVGCLVGGAAGAVAGTAMLQTASEAEAS